MLQAPPLAHVCPQTISEYTTRSDGGVVWVLCRLERVSELLAIETCYSPEVILVIFGRRSSFFLFESSWKAPFLGLFSLCSGSNMKWHHICAHAQWWLPWILRNVEKRHLALSNIRFNESPQTKTVSQNERRRADLQKFVSRFFNFCPQDLNYDLSKLTDNFTPFFLLWKTITKSLGNN